MTKCENCGGEFKPYLSNQRFCSRICGDQFYQCERKEAVEWYRACGLRPQTKADQAKAESERAA
jgi:hypothetical protein